MAQLSTLDLFLGLILMAGAYAGIFIVLGGIAELIERFYLRRKENIFMFREFTEEEIERFDIKPATIEFSDSGEKDAST